MLIDYAVLKTRLDTLVLDGKSPDGCITHESSGNRGHFDFVFQKEAKPVGIVRLHCTENERNAMHSKVLKEIELINGAG
jgi:hypothetical protein